MCVGYWTICLATWALAPSHRPFSPPIRPPRPHDSSKWESSIVAEAMSRFRSPTTTLALPSFLFYYLWPHCSQTTQRIKRKVIGTTTCNHGAHILKVIRTYGKNLLQPRIHMGKAAHILCGGRPVHRIPISRLLQGLKITKMTLHCDDLPVNISSS